MEPLPRVFDMLQYFKTICLQWKAFDLLNKIRYVLFLLEACDVTKNGSHLGCHLGFYQVLEIRLKHHFIHRLCFYCWKKLKNMHFPSKMAWPPATYDIILVTLVTEHHLTCLKMCLGDKWTASKNVRCWCFIVKEKTQKKSQRGGVATTPPPPCTSQG